MAENQQLTYDKASRQDDGLQKLGAHMRTTFEKYKKDRFLAEEQFLRNLRQFLGVYDPDIESKFDKNQSRAYPKITRTKVVSTVSRLMNLLFPASEKNYEICPTPVPNLPPKAALEAVAPLLEKIKAGGTITQQELNEAIYTFAKDKAALLEKEIEDQMLELGGDRLTNYEYLCKQVIMSGVMYGCGVVKGPFAREVDENWWTLVDGIPQIQSKTVMKPQYEMVPIWAYYPDMTAKTWFQMDGQFERHIMSRRQVRELADRPEFFGDVIKEYLRGQTQGNFKEENFETQLRSMGVQDNVNAVNSSKYEVVEWTGAITAQDLVAAGYNMPDEMMSETFDANVWFIDNRVIKAKIMPWSELAPGYKVRTYHQFNYEENETSIFGNGLPQIMRDSQMSIAATARMALDNASVVAGPILELNTSLLRADQDLTNIWAWKMFFRDDDSPQTVNSPAIREIKIDAHLNELITIMDKFMAFADTETFVNPATGGDMQRGPSEPFRTAAGASMLRGEAALPFKDVVRNFDVFTESLITSLIAFNYAFTQKPEIKGDFQVYAKGSRSLIAKEVRGIALDSFAQSLTDGEQAYLDSYELVRERAIVRDLPDKVVVSPERAKEIDEQRAQEAALQGELAKRLQDATIKDTIASAVKNLSQSQKNTAAADATEVKTLTDTLTALTPESEGAPNGAARPAAAKTAKTRTSKKTA